MVMSPIDALEELARQHCRRSSFDPDLPKLIDSGALSANANALRTLAEAGRFRIVSENMRMVCGYWPEDDPLTVSG